MSPCVYTHMDVYLCMCKCTHTWTVKACHMWWKETPSRLDLILLSLSVTTSLIHLFPNQNIFWSPFLVQVHYPWPCLNHTVTPKVKCGYNYFKMKTPRLKAAKSFCSVYFVPKATAPHPSQRLAHNNDLKSRLQKGTPGTCLCPVQCQGHCLVSSVLP